MLFVMVKTTVAVVPGRNINLCSSTAKQFLNSCIDAPLYEQIVNICISSSSKINCEFIIILLYW